jgi:hypothetical protein
LICSRASETEQETAFLICLPLDTVVSITSGICSGMCHKPVSH